MTSEDKSILTVLLIIYGVLWLFMIFDSLGHISAILERHEKRNVDKFSNDGKPLLTEEDLDKLKKEDMNSILHHLFIAIMGPFTFPVVFFFYRVPKFIKQFIGFFKS